MKNVNLQLSKLKQLLKTVFLTDCNTVACAYNNINYNYIAL